MGKKLYIRSKVVVLQRSDLYFTWKCSFENEIIHDAVLLDVLNRTLTNSVMFCS